MVPLCGSNTILPCKTQNTADQKKRMYYNCIKSTKSSIPPLIIQILTLSYFTTILEQRYNADDIINPNHNPNPSPFQNRTSSV